MQIFFEKYLFLAGEKVFLGKVVTNIGTKSDSEKFEKWKGIEVSKILKNIISSKIEKSTEPSLEE